MMHETIFLACSTAVMLPPAVRSAASAGRICQQFPPSPDHIGQQSCFRNLSPEPSTPTCVQQLRSASIAPRIERCLRTQCFMAMAEDDSDNKQPATSVSSRLPKSFLTPREFSLGLTAHRSIQQLLREAPNAFNEIPAPSIYSKSVVLRGDLGQDLARGRDAYLQLFNGIAQVETLTMSTLFILVTSEQLSAGATHSWEAPSLPARRRQLCALVQSAVGGPTQDSNCTRRRRRSSIRWLQSRVAESAHAGRQPASTLRNAVCVKTASLCASCDIDACAQDHACPAVELLRDSMCMADHNCTQATSERVSG
eukprot:6185395-Pleurochrysis_carterae.AAC.1